MPKENAIVRSTFDSRQFDAIAGELAQAFAGEFGMDEVRGLTDFGIGFSSGVIRDMTHYASIAMDDASTIQQLQTTASIIMPLQFLQNWLPGFVKYIFAARKADEIMGISTIGSWEDEEIVQPVLESTGTAVIYGDTTNTPLANYNVNFNTRTVVRGEAGMRVGSLEEARASRIRVNSGQEKREAAGLALEIFRNAIGFYGYNAGNNNTYGFLNDPALPAYQEVVNPGGGTTWASKTFLQIQADILTALIQLRVQSQDTIEPNKTPITMAIATAVVDRLSTPTDFGYSVWAWMKEFYPNIRVVSAPQLNNANASDNVFYLFADGVKDMSSDDGRTFIQVVPAKFQILGVQKLTKGYEEAYSNASAGVMTKRPYAVTRWYGI